MENAEKKAEELLRANLDKLRSLAEALRDKEILDGDQIDRIIQGKPPEKPEVEKKEKEHG